MNTIVATPTRYADAHLPTGVRLRYAEQGDPTGLPVVMLHGYTDSSFSFSRVLPLLDESLRVFALDQRGHGDSDRPTAGYTPGDFASDVVAFLDALDIERAVLVGHCMGSLVAQRAALDAPERVQRLVLAGSMTSVRNLEGIEELRQAIAALGDEVPEDFAREFQEGTVYGPLPAEFMNGVVAESLKLPARVWRSVMDGLFADEHTSRLGSLRTPSLILWGERDALLGRAEQIALVSALSGAVLKVYPETGHSPQWERPERFARDLGAFIV